MEKWDTVNIFLRDLVFIFPYFSKCFSIFIFLHAQSSDVVALTPFLAHLMSMWALSPSGTSITLAVVILFIAGHLTHT